MLDHDLLSLASALAKVKHAGQVRKGAGSEPYYEHLRRVANHLGPNTRARTIAYLHDIIEDTIMTADDLRHAGFPVDITDDVVALSRLTRERYFDYIERTIRDASDDGLLVKLADLSDNLSDAWIAEQTNLRGRYIKAEIMIRAAMQRREMPLQIFRNSGRVA